MISRTNHCHFKLDHLNKKLNANMKFEGIGVFQEQGGKEGYLPNSRKRWY